MPFESPGEEEWESLPLTNPTQVKDPASLSRILNRIIKWANKDEVAPDPAIQGALITTNTADIATNASDLSDHEASDGSSHTFVNQSVKTTDSPTFSKVTIDSIRIGIVSKGSSYTATGSDYTIVVTAAATITLPSASSKEGQIICIKTSTTGFVRITADGSDQIDGSTADKTTSSQWDSITLHSNGSHWFAIQQTGF